jgi:putative spermidine/putrescine transport system substrate-binding protein
MRASAIPLLEAGEPWFHNGKDIMPHMPNTPKIMERTIVANPDWWADNGQAVNDRYAAWMAN